MKLTMFEIVQIPGLFVKFRGKDLPMKTAYNLNKIGDAVEKETKFYYGELKKIFNKYGEVDDKGQPVFTDEAKHMRKIKDGSQEDAQRELNDLTALEVEFEDKLQISLDSLEKLEVSIDELRPLIPFIKE